MSLVSLEKLSEAVQNILGSKVQNKELLRSELTLEIAATDLIEVCSTLREHSLFQFEMLMDACGVDYLQYGVSEWKTEDATQSGFSRGVTTQLGSFTWTKPRFAVVYHLLSIELNQRIRLKVFVSEENPIVPSVINIWNSANWYEREVFDLFGIFFSGHPDLRRILTDYGFMGHPFRKDFPLMGEVEMRYSAKDQRVIYEPVSIEMRTLVPKTIRSDNRYLGNEE